jgi:hypothetical protein
MQNFVLTDTHLGEVVVVRDRDHILRVNLGDHHSGVQAASIETLEVFLCTDMKASGASPVVVVVDLVSRHRDHLTGAIVEGGRVNVLEVAADTLKC